MNYNIEEILEKILERKDAEMSRVKEAVKEVSYELEDDRILDDWAGEQKLKNHVLRERPNVWKFVGSKLPKNGKNRL